MHNLSNKNAVRLEKMTMLKTQHLLEKYFHRVYDKMFQTFIFKRGFQIYQDT